MQKYKDPRTKLFSYFELELRLMMNHKAAAGIRHMTVEDGM